MKLTPREKAQKLFDRFGLDAFYVVNEILKVAPSMDTFQPGIPLLESSKEYFEQVKQEIHELF